jgi:hypothetical protein
MPSTWRRQPADDASPPPSPRARTKLELFRQGAALFRDHLKGGERLTEFLVDQFGYFLAFSKQVVLAPLPPVSLRAAMSGEPKICQG